MSFFNDGQSILPVLLLCNLKVLAAFAQHTSSAQIIFIVYGLHYYYSPWPHRLICWQLHCPPQIGKQARDVVSKKKREIWILTQLFSKRRPFPAGLGTDTFSVDLLRFHSPLDWWMKRRTCTKSGFSALGPSLFALSDDEYNLTVWPQFLALKYIHFDLNFWTSYFLCVAGLEPYVVHSQPRPNPVFPEHSAGVGPLYLSVVAGPFLLSSPLLPWPRTHSNVLPLLRQDGETSLKCWPLFSLLFTFFPWQKEEKEKSQNKCVFFFSQRYTV